MNKILSFFLILFCFSAFSAPFKGKKFVISGPSAHSVSVAQQIYKKGGNVVDMSIAVALALAVTHPYYVSLGSGGFALVKMESSVQALDFRESAGSKMPVDFFEKNSSLSSQKGGPAVGVPGFVAGLVELNKKYSQLSWVDLIQPAINLAQRGYPVTADWVEFTNKAKDQFNPRGQAIFFKKGKPYQFNEKFKQLALAQALKILRRHKNQAFYKGVIAKDIVSSVQKNQGVLTLEDFKNYKLRWLKPMEFDFRGYKIYSMPLPSSGGIILARFFKLIEKKKLYKKNLYSVEEVHLLAEIMARAFLPRQLMGDPDFAKRPNFYKNQIRKWLSDKKLDELSSGISANKRLQLPLLKESKETTHFSIIDQKGNTVSMTLTLNGFYGSKLVSSKYGIVLNNQVDDFTTLPQQANKFGLIQGKNNSIEGGKRPLSSMSPTIVEQKGQTVLSIGGAGGPTIINAVGQSLYRYLVNKMDLEQAISSNRIHHQFLPRQLFMEDKRWGPELIVDLKMKGHNIEFKNYIAQIFAVAKDKNGDLLSAGERRRESFTGGL